MPEKPGTPVRHAHVLDANGIVVRDEGGDFLTVDWTWGRTMTHRSNVIVPIPADDPNALRVTKLHEDAIVPARAHNDDAGLDLYANAATAIYAGATQIIPTGIAVAIPAGNVGMICPRSGLAAKHSITVTNAPGIIDAGYRGELQVILTNLGHDTYALNDGDRIAQLVIVPIATPDVLEVDSLDDTARGTSGIGSTGR